MINYILITFNNQLSSAPFNRVRLFCMGFQAIGCNCCINTINYPNSGYLNKTISIFKGAYSLWKLVKEMTKKDILIIYGELPYTFLYRWISKKTNFVIEKNEYPYFQIIKDLPFISFKRSQRNLASFHHAAMMITCSSSLKNYYLNYCPNIFIAPLIVDVSEFLMGKKTQRMIEEKYIAYCGSLDNNKDGVPILIQSFSKFHDTHPDVKLVIIGPGSTSSVNELKEIINENKLSKSVIMTGAIPHDEMANWLNNAVMLALARPNSRQAEGGIPSKLGEYLASKVPCVVTSVGDLPIYLKDGENCYLAEPDSIDSFVKKMTECYCNDNTKIITSAINTVSNFDYKNQARLLKQYLMITFPCAEL